MDDPNENRTRRLEPQLANDRVNGMNRARNAARNTDPNTPPNAIISNGLITTPERQVSTMPSSGGKRKEKRKSRKTRKSRRKSRKTRKSRRKHKKTKGKRRR